MRLPRRPRLLIPVVIALAAIVVLFLVFTAIFTDFLWYDSVDFSSVFSTMLLTQILLFVVGAALMVAIVGGNVALAHRMRPMFGPGMFGSPQGADRYRLAVDPHRKIFFFVGLAVLALFTGSSTAGQWKTWLLFANSTSFGKKDPLFDYDVSFFMFTLPFLRMALTFLFTAVILSFFTAAIVHYLYGGVRIASPGGLHASRAARVHLSVLLGVFVLLKAVAYFIDRYDLVFSTRGVVHGASYTDVNAVLPAKGILAVIALICALIFFAGVVRPGGMWPGAAFGLMVLSAILIGSVYPVLVEQFQVRPNQQGKEQTAISNNIAATRDAYGVADAKVETYDAQATPQQGTPTDETISGVRLLDPTLVSKTFQQKQRIRGFYDFPEQLDVDRYKDADGVVRDHLVAVREMTGPSSESDNWINRHLIYTHGYGFVAAPGSEVDSEGLPNFDAKDMPVSGSLVPSAGLKEPRIYFGEKSHDYAIVGGKKAQELDYPIDGGTGQEDTSYAGKGGVPVGSFFNRLLYAAKYGELKMLLSGDIDERSRILYDRTPIERVSKVAPFLNLDSDPYPAIVNGRVVWIVDAYTTANEYPFSQSKSFSDMIRDTSTNPVLGAPQPRDQINYIRNSVKAVVDAYDGTVTLYEWDPEDPVLKSWEKAFPGIIKPKDAIEPELRDHLRYPEDLFKVQRDVLSRYHVTDARSFYGAQDFWNIPNDPSSGKKDVKQPPYYLSVKMPGTEKSTFSLTTTFVPRKNPNLAAFMAVDATAGDDYGKLRILRMPANTTIMGPGQVQNAFTNKFSGELNVLGLGEARIRYGNLLTLPFGGGLVYIEPVYVQTAEGAGQEPYPILRRVLVMFGNRVGSADTLQQALDQVFGTSEQTTKPEGKPADKPGDKPGDKPAADPGLTGVIEKAQAAYDEAQKALNASPPDWTKYGEAQKRLSEALNELAELQRQKPAATPSPSPSGAAPSPSASPSTAAMGASAGP
ncbi:UPF0182 family membrane protein [Microtetraspora niveoalba]|uniref:UPF0182 family membrane protein n=1 Tax=Microtetraspora niveoalba TaxID=46175 RepID=UPI000A06594A|nr:UPF0182 family protein [Microtetraspora niveoalba]